MPNPMNRDEAVRVLQKMIDDARSPYLYDKAERDAILFALTALRSGGGEGDSRMVEIEPGVELPMWLLDYTQKVSLYMKANLPGPWRIGGIQSHDYPHPQPARGEAVAWYVFADTEHWVTLDRDEADENREEGCQVRPLVYGDAPAAQPAEAGKVRGLVEKWRDEAGALEAYAEEVTKDSRRWVTADALKGIANITRRRADELEAALAEQARGGG